MREESNFTQGKILGPLMAFALPVLFALFLQAMYGAVDLLIVFAGGIIKQVLKLGIPIAFQDLLVGFSFLVVLAIVNDLGVTASAGVGVAEKVCGFIMLVPAAFMQSISAFVAQNIGAGKPDRALQALYSSVAVSFAFGVSMFLLSFFGGQVLCGIFAKDAAIIVAGAEYLKAYLLFFIIIKISRITKFPRLLPGKFLVSFYKYNINTRWHAMRDSNPRPSGP